MKQLGCVVAVNFDGGGSTTAYAALPGEKSASIKNSPSGNSERKTANSILFINSQEKEGHPSVFTLTPQKPYIVSGGSEYTFGRPAVSDHSGYPADIETEWQYEYLLDPSQTDSVIRDGVTFVSGDKCGEVDIFVRIHCNGCFVAQHAGTVYVLEQPEKFTLGKDSYEISPFESINFALDYEYHTAKIFCDKNSLRWKLSLQNSDAEVEEVIADISESVANKESQDGTEVVTTDGVVSEPPASENEIVDADAPYAEEPLIEDIQVPNADGDAEAAATGESEETQQAAEEEQKSHNDFYKIEKESFFDTEMFTLSDELVLIPKVHGQSFILNARIGNLEKSTTINVKKFPYNDSFEHWSAPYLYDVHEYSLMQGEIDGTEMAFRPERNLTKAEFFTILARIINPYIDAEELAETEDSAVSEGNEPFEETQEPNDVDAVDADGIPETSDELSVFADHADIPAWAEKYFNALSSTGMLDIIASDDGTGAKYLKPSEYITRLEVLRVLGALCNETQADFVSAFADGDVLYDDIYYKFINNAIAIELFAGYEDGTLRPYELLTRAQAATVILRFYNAPKM